MEISKVIIPSADSNSCFSPFTKIIPKELLPILGKPIIQFVAEEIYKSSINNFFLIIENNKENLIKYFNNLLEDKSENYNTEKLLKKLQFNYIYQTESFGIGNSVFLAKNIINKEYFAIAHPEDLIISKQPALAQIMRIARQEKASVIAVQEVPTELVSNYNIVSIKKQINHSLFQLSHVVEKPSIKDSPSNFAVIGRYVLSHKIFNSLDYLSSYASERLNFSDAISHMIHQNERVFAFKVSGTHYDLSSQLGWIKSIINMSLQDPNLSASVQKYLNHIQKNELLYYNPAKIIEHNL